MTPLSSVSRLEGIATRPVLDSGDQLRVVRQTRHRKHGCYCHARRAIIQQRSTTCSMMCVRRSCLQAHLSVPPRVATNCSHGVPVAILAGKDPQLLTTFLTTRGIAPHKKLERTAPKGSATLEMLEGLAGNPLVRFAGQLHSISSHHDTAVLVGNNAPAMLPIQTSDVEADGTRGFVHFPSSLLAQMSRDLTVTRSS